MRFWKSASEKVKEFVRERCPQSEEAFLAGCALPANDQAMRVALGVRRAIARLGRVEPAYVHGDASFWDEISDLPFWDSLDTVELVMTLEEELGVRIPNVDAEKIRNPDDNPRLTVKDFVGDVYRVVESRVKP